MNKLLFIDIKDSETAAYIFERRKGSYEFLEVRKLQGAERHRFSLDGLPQDIDTAYVSLPLSSLNFRVIDVPFSDKDKIRDVLPFELDGMVLGGTEQVVYDNMILGSTANTYHVLAVYVDKALVRGLLDNCRSYHVDPECITSIELRGIGKDFSPEQVLSPVTVADQDRITSALGEIKAPTINLRRDEFAYTRAIEETKRSLKVTAILATLIMAVLSAGLLFSIISARTEAGRLKKEIRREYQALFPEEKNIVNELHQLKSHIKELKETEHLLTGVSPLDLLLDLSRIDRHNGLFNEITTQNGTVTLKGEAPSLSDVQDIKVELEQLFDDVTISDSKTSAGGLMVFSITAKEQKP
jgi:type II secretory pathway component PulL